MAQAFLVDVLHAGGDVAGNAVRKDDPVLHHHAAPLAPLADAEVLQRSVAQQDLTAGRRIESQQQLHQCGFSASAHAYDGSLPARCDFQTDVV